MTAFLGTVVDAAIGWLVQSILGSFFTRQMEAWTREIGLAEDVEKLKFEMRNVEMVLAAAAGRRIDNKPLARSLDDLKELLYDSEDIMDELDYYRLQQQIEQGKGCNSPSGANPEGTNVSSATPSSAFELNARLTTSIPIESKVYGRDAERDKIIGLLISGESSDLNVLPVIGIGGVGKTTLARFVYRDQRIRDYFDLQIWVCVSTKFNEVRLTLEILEHVCEDKQEYENISNFNVLQEILMRNIRNKRFLLVLDDMWEDKDRNGWTKLLAPLKSNQVNGCMVLATTRSTSVAKMIGTMDEVRLSGLDEKEFWLFFKGCAFGNENYEGDPSLQSIGKHIAKTLKGCPLAARSVGALLSTSISYKHWRTIQDKWKSLQEDADDILPILKLSYDYLPVHLQHCFSYCSLFPEDHRFSGKKLVHAWISQNFVQCKNSAVRLEDTGQQYLDRLVDLGFFQKFGSHFFMHDLMHELARKVSSNECATIDGLKPDVIQSTVRHLSIITTAFEADEHGSEKIDTILQKIGPLPKLRTLMLFGKSSIDSLGSFRTLCKEAKCLRFLRITVIGADKNSILSLLNPCHLRYLDFVCACTRYRIEYGGYTNITLPQALTRFYHLQVLNVGISGNFDVPVDMNNLVNLRHLIAHEKVHHAIDYVSNMSFLQELNFKVQNVGSYEIGQLKSMNELVLLRISHLENVTTKEEVRRARLIDKEYLETLSLSWEDCSLSLQPEAAKDLLDGLQPYHNLKTLEIIGYGGATSPTWLSSNFSVTSVQTLHLQKCREWKILPSLEMLPFLRKLILIGLLNVVEISVPSLEELILIDMPKLEKCIGSYGMELTSHLKVLKINRCPQLNEFTLFQSYSSFNAEQKSWFPSLNKLAITHSPHIINWEIIPLRGMSALKELKLMDLHVVRELSIPSLEKLVLTKMPNLEICSSLTTPSPLQILPSQGDQKVWMSSLQKLTIHACPRLTVSYPVLPSAPISWLSIRGVPTLPAMSITGGNFTIQSNVLSVLDESILASCKLRNITSLCIRNCPNLVSLSSEAFSQLIALKYVRILNCPNLTKSNIMSDVVQENCTPAGSLVLPSLKSLIISKCGITGRWLTHMLPHSHSLKVLVLINCPEIKLLSISQPTETEGISSSVMVSDQDEHLLKIPCNILCSLKDLSIKSCQDLEFCGGKADFGGFTSLMNLEFYNCPKLVPSLVGEMKDMDTGLLPPSLEVLRISDLPENLQSFTPKSLVYLKKLCLLCSPYLTAVHLHSCVALVELRIWCKRLAVLEGLQFLSSLRSLDIRMNPELSRAWKLKLQEKEQGGNQVRLLPPSLEELKISDLTDRVQSRLLSCGLLAVTKLNIWASRKLTSLQLGYCTTLKELEITMCDSLASIEGLQFRRNLKSLKVFNSPGAVSCLGLVSHQQGASEVWSGLETLGISDVSVLSVPLCKQLTSLKRLEYICHSTKPRESMVSLTEEQERALQLLTSLQELKIQIPNLLSLPTNLHSLTSLKMLSIFHCESITRLPDTGLPLLLRNLQLSGCSKELGMQCRRAATRRLNVTIDNMAVN